MQEGEEREPHGSGDGGSENAPRAVSAAYTAATRMPAQATASRSPSRASRPAPGNRRAGGAPWLPDGLGAGRAISRVGAPSAEPKGRRAPQRPEGAVLACLCPAISAVASGRLVASLLHA